MIPMKRMNRLMKYELVILTSGLGLASIPVYSNEISEVKLPHDARIQMMDEAWSMFGRITAKKFKAYSQFKKDWVEAYIKDNNALAADEDRAVK